MSLPQSLFSIRRPLAPVAAGVLIAATALGGCAQEQPTGPSPETIPATASATADESSVTSSAPDAAQTTTDAAATTTASDDSDGASSTSDPTVLSAADGGFAVELPTGWTDAIDVIDTAGVQVATKAPEQVDGFFTNILVTKEKYVKNLTSAVEATAKELAGKEGEYELLDPVEVDGNKAPGYTITREVSGKTLVQTQRWVSHDGTLYVATLSSLESEAKENAPLLDSMLSSWTWED